MDTARFLEAVWGTGLHSVCWLNEGRMKWRFAHGPEQAAPAPELLPDRDLWFGAHPLHSEPPPNRRGDASFVAQVVAIPADLDWADPSRRTDKVLPDEHAVRTALARLGPDLQPSIIVQSGHGLQPWWLLDQPVPPELGAELVARISGRLLELGIENGRQDLASILRLPGSTNWKDPDRPMPVIIEVWEPRRLFLPEYLRRHIPLPTGWTPSLGGGTRHHGSGAITDGQLDVQNYVMEHHGGHSPQGRGGVIYLWRPGKDSHGGHSATILVGDQGDAVLTVFSSNWATIGPDDGAPCWSWVLRLDHLVRAHLADREELDALLAAGTALGARPEPTVRTVIDVDQDDDDDRLLPVDWAARHTVEQEDIVPGLILPGRWTQLVGGAKSGKSTLLVWATLRTSHGIHPFDATPMDAHTVLWLDGEMGEDDLAELIDGCGYDPEALKAWWAVTRQPRLDRPDDAERLLTLVAELEADVVVLDGLNSFLSPGHAEKDDQGWRSLFRLTIAPLKRRGVAVVSADNLGKDLTKGSRGSSVKTDKADAVFALTRLTGGAKLTVTHRRVGGFLTDLVLNVEGVEPGDNRPISYQRTSGSGWPEGTRECRAAIERLRLPPNVGRIVVIRALKAEATRLADAGKDPSDYQWRTTTIAAALRWRKLDPIWRHQDVPS